MLKSLAWKEMRELLPLAAVAGLAQTYLVLTAMGLRLGPYGRREEGIPFIYDEYCAYLLMVAGVAMAAIGLWQTWQESSRGTFLFLLHRPAERSSIIGAKLGLGFAISLAVAALPVLVYALWAAKPGTHASPFEWSMTSFMWQLCLELPLVYLGAFLSGLRPARWFGSRLFPLAAGGSAVLLIHIVSRSSPLVSLALLAVADACFLLAIFQVAASRDYS